MKNSLAVAMGRVSTFTQAAQGMSLADQEVLFPEYAKKQGHNLVKAFSFNESAATSDKRRLFREVVEYIKAHDIGHFYVEDTERLTRDSMDIPIINDLAINHGVTLHFIRDGYVLDKDMENFVNFMMRLTFGQETILRLRKKMKAKMLHLVSQGQWPMRPPWCSRVIEKKLVWQDVTPLQELYRRRAEGASIAQLEDWLTVSGHKPPRGEVWHQQTIVKILQNPANIGKLRWKGVLHDAAHDAVISEDLFDKVQKTFTLTSRKNNRRAHLFSGLLRLEGNGRLFSGEEQKGRVYYAAYTRPRGPRVWLSEEAIFETADDIMRRIRMDSHFGGFITDVAKDMVKFQYAHVGRKIQAKEKLISELRGKYHQVYQDRLDGIIGLDLYKVPYVSLPELYPKRQGNCRKPVGRLPGAARGLAVPLRHRFEGVGDLTVSDIPKKLTQRGVGVEVRLLPFGDDLGRLLFQDVDTLFLRGHAEAGTAERGRQPNSGDITRLKK